MASSPASQVYIVSDDNDGLGLDLGGGGWSFDVKDFYFGALKRVIWPGFAINESSPRGSFNYQFDGTEIRLFGITANVGTTQVFQVTIDDNAPYNTSTDDTNPEHYRQWYQSPPLSGGSHNISFDLLDGQALDYILVAPSPQTPLLGQTLMVDDTYNGIQYGGGWQAVQDSTYVQSSIIPGNNFMNSSHQTSTVGDSLTFSYTGTNLTVWGTFLWEKVGGMTLSYNIDGGANLTQTFTSDGTNPIKEEPNFKLVDTGSISPGNHTLTLTLSDCIAQTLIVDYILYTPSFDNLASMPNLTALTSGQNPTSTGAQTSASSTSTTTFQSNHRSNTGAIVGGVIGGIAVVALLGALVFLCLKRHSKAKANEEPEFWATTTQAPPNRPPRNPNYIEPFPGPAIVGRAATSRSVPMSAKSDAASISTFGMSSYYQSTSPTTGYDSYSMVGHPVPTNAPPLPIKRYVQNPGDDAMGSGTSERDDLQRQVDQLTEENRNLAAMHSPPAYYTH